jgi:hypothetical protein
MGGILMLDLTIKPKCKQKNPEYSLAATWISGLPVVLTLSSSSAKILLLHHLPEKEKVVSFSWAVILPIQ